MKRRFLHAKWIPSLWGPADLVLHRYGRELARFHAEDATTEIGLAANRGEAEDLAEQFAHENGYTGLLWSWE